MADLTQVAIVLGVALVLALVAARWRFSAIPAFLIAGLLLGPHGPGPSVIEPSDAIDLLAEIGLAFVLFFLGLEFSPERMRGLRSILMRGGFADLLINMTLGFALGMLLFGPGLAAVVVAGAVYVSSSGIVVKALSDFRRLADPETDFVLSVLVFEDIVIALFLAVVGTLLVSTDLAFMTVIGPLAKALVALVLLVLVGAWLARQFVKTIEVLPLDALALGVVAVVLGFSAVFEEAGLSAGLGALVAGFVFADTPIRQQIERSLLSFREVFAAVFFFSFGLHVDLGAVSGDIWFVVLAVLVAAGGKVASGILGGHLVSMRPRRALSAGLTLTPRGEFSVVLAQFALVAPALPAAVEGRLAAIIGVFVIASAVLGVTLLKSSKTIGRAYESRLKRKA